MRKRFKLKIYGKSPRSLILAYVLAQFNCDVYILDLLIKSNKNNDYQIFLFSNFLKNLLVNFEIWNEIEDISYYFNSLIFNDYLLFEKLLLKKEILSDKYLNTFGWTAKYSEIKSLLIKKLNNLDNVHFISKNQLIEESLNFDFEFNFKSCDEYPLSNFKKTDNQSIIFNAYLRGNVDKRLYEINTNNGLLILTPINKYLYQIIWNNAPIQINERSLSSKSFFLDNLTIMLPDELKIDEIIGDINFFNVNNISSTYLIKKKSVFFNENKFKSNILYEFEFDMVIRNIIQIFNFLENNETKIILILNRIGLYYLYRKCINFKIKFSFTKFLINLFIFNNIFLLFIRKLLFNLFKRTNLIKFYIIKNLTNVHFKI